MFRYVLDVKVSIVKERKREIRHAKENTNEEFKCIEC